MKLSSFLTLEQLACDEGGVRPRHFCSSIRVLPRPSCCVAKAAERLSCLSLDPHSPLHPSCSVFMLTLAAYPLFQQRILVSFSVLKVVWTQSSNSIPIFIPVPPFVPCGHSAHTPCSCI